MEFSTEDSQRIIGLLSCVPNGVQAMSKDIPGLVESSMNLGIVSLTADGFSLTVSLRSSVNHVKAQMQVQLEDLARRCGAEFSSRGEYPAWEYRRESALRDMMVEAFTALYGKVPTVAAIHAGLECGLFSSHIPDLDSVSFGPDILEIHTPRERLPIDSVQRTWSYLLDILARL